LTGLRHLGLKFGRILGGADEWACIKQSAAGISQLAQLTSLALQQEEYWQEAVLLSPLAALTGLQQLQLVGCQLGTLDALQGLPPLQHLQMHSFKLQAQPGPSPLFGWLQQQDQLTCLMIDQLPHNGTSAVYAAVTASSRLQELHLGAHLSDCSWRQVFRPGRQLLQLTVIRFQGAGFVKQRQFMVQACLNLRQLAVECKGGLSSPNCLRLTELAQLTGLTVLTCVSTRDLHLAGAHTCSALRDLQIEGSWVTHAGLRQPAELRQLTALHIESRKLEKRRLTLVGPVLHEGGGGNKGVGASEVSTVCVIGGFQFNCCELGPAGLGQVDDQAHGGSPSIDSRSNNFD
jgi:hypothetical protein